MSIGETVPMLRFDRAVVDVPGRTVELDGEPQHLEPQAFDLLAYLVAHRDRFVPKTELLEEVWGDQFVSESALTTRIKEIRRAVGDDGTRQAVVRNQRGRGYRFVAEVESPDAVRLDTALHGRRDDAAGVLDLLERSSVVTLVGPGGVGKTSLAREVGRQVGDRFGAGVRTVALTRVDDPSEVVHVLRSHAGMDDAGPDETDLTAAVADLDALLVVDNCEHVIDEVAGIVETLLTRLGELRILATSRERLGVPGETVVPVSPLPTTVDAPGATSSDADTLFVWRAREVDPGFDSTRAAQVIADICARLDGIPLAIELAAARTRSLSVADIAARLDDRFRVLAGTRRTTATRQRTLRAAIDWSYELLAPPERLVLQRVALLASSFDLATAEAVAGGDDLAPEDVADALGRLVEQSMVVAESGASPRYRLLETIRAYALDRLAAAGAGATEATGRRLVDHYTELVSMADPKLRTAEQPAWLDRLTTEYDNITAALERAWSIDPGAAVRLTGRLTWFWHLRAMFDEAGRWLEPALALPADGHEHAMAEVNLAASILSRHSPLSAEGRAFIATALDLARTSGNAPVEGRALTMTGALEMAVDPAAGLATIATAREIFETAGEPWGVALNWYVASVASRGDVHAARQYAEAALAIFEQTGDPWGTALAEQALGACLRTLGDYAAAAQIYASALRRARGIGAFREATAHTELATVAILQGDHAAAARHLAAGSHLAERYPTSAATGAALDAAGFLARRTGRYDDAIAHHTRALTINRDWQLAHGIAYSLSSLALAEELVGRLDSARAHHLEGLAVARQLGDDLAVAFALEGLAAVAAAGGVDAARAATLLGAAHRLRADRGVPLPPGADLDAGRAREAAVVQLGQPRFDLAFAEGLALQAEEIERVAAAE